MFQKILIANRGEIACRVAATCRRLGIRTVAVYSEADADARHVSACDEAVAIGPAPAAQSYLSAARVIEAALRTGAQAIHPGYGFLSENAAFAQACRDAGLVFIGPPPSAIEAMGSKSAAKQLMEKAGVPLVPGYHGQNQNPDLLRREASRIGYPVLIKATAGGGGKGMRVVNDEAAFDAALASCQREAQSSFGSAEVLLEKYLRRARHVEVQVFADTQGHCVHLFERDCSAQRRHQKVLEEAPAPGLTAEQRERIGQAAVAAAQAVGYVGAGTVEFIVESLLDEDARAATPGRLGQFYFMEMNTRLQVEHPVTEMITGLDLVEWQLRVAAGEPLPLRQDQVRMHGHALEARLYAENPRQQFLPSIGRLNVFDTPAARQFTVGDVEAHTDVLRIDAGVREGDAITPYYDPMIAKLIAWGKDRDQALSTMRDALQQVRVVGVHTNAQFLLRLVDTPAFAGAQLHTGLIEANEALLQASAPHPSPEVLALACAAALRCMHGPRSQTGLGAEESTHVSPWSSLAGWRLNGVHTRVLRLHGEHDTHACKIVYATPPGARDARATIEVDDDTFHARLDAADDADLIRPAPATAHLRTVCENGRVHVFADGQHWVFDGWDPLATSTAAEEDGGHLNAPMPGRIVSLLVQEGQSVSKGAPLLVMEAMKMEHTITAPHDGLIDSLPHAEGDQVSEGTALVILKPLAPVPTEAS